MHYLQDKETDEPSSKHKLDGFEEVLYQ